MSATATRPADAPRARTTILAVASLALVAVALQSHPDMRDWTAKALLTLSPTGDATADATDGPAAPSVPTAAPDVAVSAEPVQPPPATGRFGLAFAQGDASLPLGLYAGPDAAENYASLARALSIIPGLSGIPGVELVWLGAPGPLLRDRAAAAQAALDEMLDARHAVRLTLHFAAEPEAREGMDPDRLLLTIRAGVAAVPDCPHPLVIADPDLPGATTDPDRAAAIPMPSDREVRVGKGVSWRLDDGPWTPVTAAAPPERCDTLLHRLPAP